MKKFVRMALAIVVAPGLMVGLGAGCTGGSGEIPLAKVSTPPPLPAQDKSKSKSPASHSPSELPGGP